MPIMNHNGGKRRGVDKPKEYSKVMVILKDCMADKVNDGNNTPSDDLGEGAGPILEVAPKEAGPVLEVAPSYQQPGRTSIKGNPVTEISKSIEDMKLEKSESDLEEELLEQRFVSLKQRISFQKVNMAGIDIHVSKYKKNNKKEKAHIKIMKALVNKKDQRPQKSRKKKTPGESKNVDVKKAEKSKTPGQSKNVDVKKAEKSKDLKRKGRKIHGDHTKKHKHHSVRPVLLPVTPSAARRTLQFTPELLAMIRIVFQHDIQNSTIRTRKIREGLSRNPELQRMCNKIGLSIENIRNRLRMMNKELRNDG